MTDIMLAMRLELLISQVMISVYFTESILSQNSAGIFKEDIPENVSREYLRAHWLQLLI
jgi:hypothetical protein